MSSWLHATGSLPLDRPRILGIINVTPDSFSDGGRFDSVDDVISVAAELIAAGADVLDVGGESTRPGATPIDETEELSRVIPVIEALHATYPRVPISVDTVKHGVAAAALGTGASIVNDVSALRLDPEMGRVCAKYGAGVVLMHSRGEVSDMASLAHATYGEDVAGEVVRELGERVREALATGVEASRIVVDPGIGFSKRSVHSLSLLAHISRLATLGFPVLIGASRKRFIGEITGVRKPADRLFGTLAAHVVALERGARLFRVHDVRAHREALDVAWSIAKRGQVSGDPAR